MTRHPDPIPRRSSEETTALLSSGSISEKGQLPQQNTILDVETPCARRKRIVRRHLRLATVVIAGFLLLAFYKHTRMTSFAILVSRNPKHYHGIRLTDLDRGIPPPDALMRTKAPTGCPLVTLLKATMTSQLQTTASTSKASTSGNSRSFLTCTISRAETSTAISVSSQRPTTRTRISLSGFPSPRTGKTSSSSSRAANPATAWSSKSLPQPALTASASASKPISTSSPPSSCAPSA